MKKFKKSITNGRLKGKQIVQLSNKNFFKKIYFFPQIWKKKFFGFSISFLLEIIFSAKFYSNFKQKKQRFHIFIFCFIVKILEKNLDYVSILFLKNQEESLSNRITLILLNRIFDEKLKFLSLINYFRNDIRISKIFKKLFLNNIESLDCFLIKIFFPLNFFWIHLFSNQSRKYYFKKALILKIKSKLKYFKKIYETSTSLYNSKFFKKSFS